MNRVEHLTGQAGHHARRAGREARPWVRPLARAGYAAKGVLYITIGILAAMAAFGGGGDGATTGSKGAIRAIQEQPFGQVLLVLLTVGLAGYALWRFVQAILDPEGEGTDAKGAASSRGSSTAASSSTRLASSRAAPSATRAGAAAAPTRGRPAS